MTDSINPNYNEYLNPADLARQDEDAAATRLKTQKGIFGFLNQVMREPHDFIWFAKEKFKQSK